MAIGIAADNYPLWFLAAFFVSKTVYDIVRDFVESHLFDKISRYRLVIEICIVCLISVFGYLYSLHKPFGHSVMRFDTGLVMLPFFLVGRLLPDAFNYIETKNLMLPLILVSLGLNILSGLFLNDLVSVNSNEYGNIIMFFVSTISGSMVVFIACKYVEKYRIPAKILAYFGRYSLSLLCCHAFVLAVIILIILVLYPNLRNYPIIITFICLVALAPILPAVNKMTKYISKLLFIPYEKSNYCS